MNQYEDDIEMDGPGAPLMEAFSSAPTTQRLIATIPPATRTPMVSAVSSPPVATTRVATTVAAPPMTNGCITFPVAPGGTGEGKVCGASLDNAWAFHNPTDKTTTGTKTLYVANWDNTAKQWSWATNNAWMFRSDGTLSCGNRSANKRLVLYDGAGNEDVVNATNFYGFGINSYTLRYQAPSGPHRHRFYIGAAEKFTVADTLVDIKTDLHLRSNLFLSYNGDWNTVKEANPWILHAPHDLRDNGLKTLYVAFYSKAKRDWSWAEGRTWMFRSNGTFSHTNIDGNKKLVLWDGDIQENVADAINFYGFGINSHTQRYQVPEGSYHRFYSGNQQRMAVHSITEVFTDLHAKQNLVLSSKHPWSDSEEANSWIFHNPHDKRDSGLKTLYIAYWSKAKKNWSWSEGRVWMFRSNGTLSHTNAIANKKLVLYDAGATDDVATATQFYGFGINASTQRYQVPEKAVHRFYVGNDLRVEMHENHVDVKPDLHLRSNMILSSPVDWSSTKEANPWIFHSPHDGRDGGLFKTLYIAPWDKEKKNWGWASANVWMFRSNGALVSANRMVNKRLVLWDDNAAEPVDTATQFFGFGINAGALRYQTPANRFHTGYVGDKKVFQFSDIGAKLISTTIEESAPGKTLLTLKAPLHAQSIHSLAFMDSAQNEIHTGMGLIPGNQLFSDSKGCLATNIHKDFEASWFSDNQTKLFGIRGDSGDITWNGKRMNLQANVIFQSAGRLHLHGSEKLYVLNKEGLVIGKEWGGNGTLQVQGDIYALGGKIQAPGRLHLHGGEKLYVLNKQGAVIGKEWGGSGDLLVQGTLGLGGPATGGNIQAFGETVINLSEKNKQVFSFGAGEAASKFMLQANGDVVVYRGGNPLWATKTQVSDLRRKTKIQPYEGGLATIQQLRPITYEYLPEVGTPGPQIGFGAQDLEISYPYAVQKVDDHLLVNKEEIVPALVSAVQELAAALAAEKEARLALEARLAALEAK